MEGKIYSFGECELDVARRVLTRAGDPVDIQPKAFDLLAFLIENRHRAVDKDELQDAVWPGSIITETALTRCVMKARRAVGDDAQRQAVIATVHGHGYRFVADLQEVEQAPAPPPAAAPEPAAPSTASTGPAEPGAPDSIWGRALTRAAAAVVVLAALAVGITLFRPSPDSAGPVRVAVLPVANATGDVEFDWTRLGLMSLVARLVSDAGVPVVSARQVLNTVGDGMTEGADTGDEVFAADDLSRLRRAYGASHIAQARLARSGELFRLDYVLTGPAGTIAERTTVGGDAIELAQGLGRDLLALLGGRRLGGREVRVISDDPFANEAYARGLDLQLQGDSAQAKALFEAAATQAPESFWPRYEIALSHRILGESDVALSKFLALREELGDEGDAAKRVALNNGLGILYWRLGRMEDAQACYEEALALSLQGNDGVPTGTVLINLGILARNRGDLDEARDFLNRAVTAFLDAGYEEPPGTVVATLGRLDMQEGNLAAAEDRFQRAAASFRLADARRFESITIRNLAEVRRMQGRWEESRALFDQAQSMAREIGDRRGEMAGRLGIAELDVDTGRLAEAEALARAAARDAEDIDDAAGVADAAGVLGTVHEARGDYAAARSAYIDSRDRFDAIEAVARVIDLRLRLACLEARVGDAKTAARESKELWEKARAGDFAIAMAEAQACLAEAKLALGAPDHAAEVMAGAITSARNAGNPALEARLASRLAEIYLDDGRADAAEPLVGLAAEVLPEAADTLRLRARLAWARERPDEAMAFMEKARASAGELWGDDDENLLASFREAPE